MPLSTKADGPLLDKAGAEINFVSRQLSLVDNNETPYARGIESTKHAAPTMFPKDKLESDKPLQMRKEETSSSVHSLDNPPLDKSTQNSKSWLVKLAQEVTIAPRCRRVVTAKLVLEKKIPALVCIEPAAIPIQGILTARELSRVETVPRDTSRLTSAHTS